jgi:serine/threonine protein kinase
VFPFVQSTLAKILDGMDFSSCTGLEEEKSPNHWMWRQYIAVVKAMSYFHRQLGDSLEIPMAAYHCDLKPENILVTRNGKFKIADFGESILDMLTDFDDEPGNKGPRTEYRTGDIIYRAPDVYRPKFRERVRQYGVSQPCSTMSQSSGASGVCQIYLNYDVWQLACIMLLVVTYMFQGTGGVQDLHAKRDQSEENFQFFKRTNGGFTARNFIWNRFDELYDGFAKKDVRIFMFLKHLRELAEFMFITKPHLRMQSHVVHAKLEEIMERYNDPYRQQKIIFKDLSSKMLAKGPCGDDVRAGYFEVGWTINEIFTPLCNM